MNKRSKPVRRSWGVRTGRFKPTRGKSLLICIGDQPSNWMSAFVRAFRELNPRENIFYLNAQHRDLGVIADGDCLPYPLAIRLLGFRSRYLRKLRASLILVDSGITPPDSFLKSALGDRITVGWVDHHEMGSDPAPAPQDLGALDVKDAAASLSVHLAGEREGYIKLKKRVRFFLWRHIVSHFYSRSLRRLDSVSELRSALNTPTSILCLGNGPSSEDPAIDEGVYDAVLRVNHRWLDRGRYLEPGMVFTGAVESVIRVGANIVYSFINDERAMRMVMRARHDVPRLSFTNAADLGFPLENFYPYQPTNGLLMLYVACALAPQKLTVAGIDLYQDPRGCYPDQTSVPNNYTAAHDEAKELEMILSLLAAYDGELNIIGDKLAAQYQRRVNQSNHLNAAS